MFEVRSATDCSDAERKHCNEEPDHCDCREPHPSNATSIITRRSGPGDAERDPECVRRRRHKQRMAAEAREKEGCESCTEAPPPTGFVRAPPLLAQRPPDHSHEQ